MSDLKKKIEKYDNMLNKHIENKDFVKIFRTVTDGDADISGFILKMSKEFLLIQKELEFYLNGYSIIRKDHFDSIAHDKYERAFKKILVNENIFEKEYGIANNIELNTWKDIFSDLRKFDYHVIIECEDLKNPTFTIGPIKKMTKKFVEIQNYDPTGLLDSKNTKIKYEKITLVSFGDRYINVFRKYLREKKKKK